ncbi:unnamed protein product [Pleuronectes platessa]|uniref:Cytoskeleton-associated protein 4 n=1 Tax=Pleuronectes platessa TaxID=8262 RepID=A0A9N7YGS2_PLEPL|nr:unnamed protein product [Pleuronectes platessa]
MTAKNKNKSSSAEKSAAPVSQDEAPKKTQKSPSNGSTGSPGPQGPRTRGGLGLLLNTVFYAALVGAAGFAAFHLQQVVEEIRESNARTEQSAQRSAELGSKMESVVLQVESLRSSVDGLDSSLSVTRVELQGAISRMKTGEVETRRVKEALQNLQNDLLRDLSEGISEVKEARERDFSSLEKTVEERLAEVSQSIKVNMAEVTEAQGEAQSQLADLKARLGDMEDPAFIKEELSAIVEAVAEIKTSNQADHSSGNSLREQIGAVREELQTRNQEVASLSQEVETVRSVVQENVGSLRQSLSEAEAEVQALKDKSLVVEGAVEQAAEVAREVEREANAAAAQAQRRSEELEARVRASEETGDSLSASVSEITSKVESLLAKLDTHESALAAQVQKAKAGLEQELETLKSSMGELQSNVVALVEAGKDSSLDEQVKDLEKRLAALESLRRMVAGLEDKTAKLEGHDQAIAALQEALQETIKKLAGASKKKK